MYAEVVGRKSEHWLACEKLLRNGFDSGEFFEQKVSKINKHIRKALPLDGYAYLIVSTEEKSCTKYGLRLNPEQICL